MNSSELSQVKLQIKKEYQSTDFSMMQPQITLPDNAKKFMSPDGQRFRGHFFTLIDQREDLTYLNVFSLARSLRKLTSSSLGTGKLEEPELKAMSGFKLLFFLWLNAWLINFYSLDLFSNYLDKLTYLE